MILDVEGNRRQTQAEKNKNNNDDDDNEMTTKKNVLQWLRVWVLTIWWKYVNICERMKYEENLMWSTFYTVHTYHCPFYSSNAQFWTSHFLATVKFNWEGITSLWMTIIIKFMTMIAEWNICFFVVLFLNFMFIFHFFSASFACSVQVFIVSKWIMWIYHRCLYVFTCILLFNSKYFK